MRPNQALSATNPSGAGTLDGTWRLDAIVCNGTAFAMGPAVTTLTILRATGSISNQMCTVPLTLVYPAASQVNWTMGVGTCTPESGLNASQMVGKVDDMTYAVAGSTLTLTEALTSPNDWVCSAGDRKVSTWTLSR